MSITLLMSHGVHPWSLVGDYGMNETNIDLILNIIFRELREARSLNPDSSEKLMLLLVLLIP